MIFFFVFAEMGYWKSKLLPKIKKVFEKNGSKKAAAEACKSFDDSKVGFCFPYFSSIGLFFFFLYMFSFCISSLWLPPSVGIKEVISKELEEKKTELQPKVVEVYEASSTEIKVSFFSQTPIKKKQRREKDLVFCYQVFYIL